MADNGRNLLLCCFFHGVKQTHGKTIPPRECCIFEHLTAGNKIFLTRAILECCTKWFYLTHQERKRVSGHLFVNVLLPNTTFLCILCLATVHLFSEQDPVYQQVLSMKSDMYHTFMVPVGWYIFKDLSTLHLVPNQNRIPSYAEQKLIFKWSKSRNLLGVFMIPRGLIISITVQSTAWAST